MFLQVSVCPHGGGGHAWLRGACVVAGGVRGCSRGCVVARGACVVVRGGHAWFFSGGACMVAQGHTWLLQGGMHGFFGGHALLHGVCVWLLQGDGMCGCSLGGGMHGFWGGGMHGFFQECMVFWGACMVFSGGHAWFFQGQGGVHGFFWGACVVFSRGGVRRIRRDTVNERAVRILLECILVVNKCK